MTFSCLAILAALSPVAWSAMVEILPSDDAFGVVNFTANSLMQTVTEGTGSSATFTVQRTGGTLGAVIVYWQASGKDLRDLIDTNGTVVIATGSRTAQFSIRIRADEVTRLDYWWFLSWLVTTTTNDTVVFDVQGL